MTFFDLLLISVGLALDAFAVSICKGLLMQDSTRKNGFFIALTFGLFQAFMTLLGWALGNLFFEYLNAYGRFISFGLLLLIGIKMIYESRKSEEEEKKAYVFKLSELLILGIATSIDAFAIGITFVFSEINILFSIYIVGLITFVLCAFGVFLGNKFGKKYKYNYELMGGIVLILLGFKALLF